jgi:hypothetical protein
MTACRTADEAYAAGYDDAQDAPPLTQDQADYVAAVLASGPERAKAAA